jgi:two-component sensor histidine kinase/integral membrane sensor domain MASE1
LVLHRLPSVHDTARLILVAFAYFIVASLGLQLASINPSATPIWPATGAAIAAILLWGYRVVPAIFIAALLVNQLTAGSVFTSLGIAFGNTLEAATAVYLVRRWADGERIFDTPIGVVRFAQICLVVTMISATIGVGSLLLAGYAETKSAATVWLTWWLGDLAGALVIGPVVVLWFRSTGISLSQGQLSSTGLTYLAAIVVGVIAFSPLIPQSPIRDPLGFLVILPLLWAALRRGPRDTATVAMIFAAFAIWGTMINSGPFARATLNESFLLLLMFMISVSVPSLALSADLAERQRVQDQQQLLLRELSHRVGNTLAVLQSVFRRSAHHARTVPELEDAFEARLMNLAATHQLLSENNWRSAAISGLVRCAVQPYCRPNYSDCQFSGKEVLLPASMVLTLTMILHELATNAAKHGAFRSKGGKLKVSWQQALNRKFQLNWVELGVPDCRAEKISGYGTTLIDTTIIALGGSVDRMFSEDGISVRLSIPLS